MAVNILVGDVIQAFISKDYDMLAHGCNCFHTMGAGIARKLSKKWPIILEKDKETSYGDINKLGDVCYVEVAPGKIVANAYTQFSIGPNNGLSEESIRNAFTNVFVHASISSIKRHKVCCPAVGMGLGGGDPNKILPILTDIFQQTDLDLYVLDEETAKQYREIVAKGINHD